ncbi:hypothetical protein [Acidipila rosea]|uniref:DUF4145 domain-containing protein n=1 Tax=Acidipila rosea TaxID=768535 RepID=A0A4R1LD61_9BACT|nr:hypothetical protein [Acidipila rosea]TCK75637.1 hypothetical protein C7378_0623 [Acidipila rosea]
MALNDEIITQIDEILGRYKTLRSRSKWSDLSDLNDTGEPTAILTLICDTVKRFAPPRSQYSESVSRLLQEYGPDGCGAITPAMGVLSALRDAYSSGYSRRFAELVHAELFSDFLEMSEYLLSEGFKDPAAVIIGSVLEEHLRQLCVKNSIDINAPSGKPKKADQLNADLAGQGVYSKLDQKSVTGWLDLRNRAAHGKHNEYTMEQVTILLTSVQNFMTRIPA